MIDRPRAIYLLSLVVAVVWLLLIIAPAWLLASGSTGLAITLYRALSLVCHQIPERTFHLAGGLPLAVCSRCSGIYVGGLLGLLVYPLFRPITSTVSPERIRLLAAAVPMLIDFGGDQLGLFHNTFLSRTLTGLIVGMAAAFFLLPGLIAAGDEFRRTTEITSNNFKKPGM